MTVCRFLEFPVTVALPLLSCDSSHVVGLPQQTEFGPFFLPTDLVATELALTIPILCDKSVFLYPCDTPLVSNVAQVCLYIGTFPIPQLRAK